MPITLDDFKEGGSLRNFVTQVGLLGKIGKDGVNQTELLNTLINSVTMVGAYTDSNSDGAITSADSVSNKFSKEEDKNTEGGENAVAGNNEGGSTVVENPESGGSTEGSNTNESGDEQEPTDDPKEEETEPEDKQDDDTPGDVDSPSVDPTDGE